MVAKLAAAPAPTPTPPATPPPPPPVPPPATPPPSSGPQIYASTPEEEAEWARKQAPQWAKAKGETGVDPGEGTSHTWEKHQRGAGGYQGPDDKDTDPMRYGPKTHGHQVMDSALKGAEDTWEGVKDFGGKATDAALSGDLKGLYELSKGQVGKMTPEVITRNLSAESRDNLNALIVAGVPMTVAAGLIAAMLMKKKKPDSEVMTRHGSVGTISSYLWAYVRDNGGFDL